MQGPSISMRIQFHPRALCFGRSIVRHDGQHAIQHQFFFSIAPKIFVTQRNLLEYFDIARVEVERVLQVLRRLFPAPLTPLNGALPLKHERIIGLGMAENLQLVQSPVIIEVDPIKIQCPCKMCFASIRTEAKRRLNGGFRQGQPRGTMVVASEVNGVMSVGELAKRIEKRRIACDSLIQQLDPLKQIRFCLTTEARSQNKIFRAAVKIEGCEIGSRPALNGQFLRGRNFGVKLLSDFLCDLTLDCEYVIQVAIVLFRPHMCVSARVDQLGVHVKLSSDPAYATLYYVR